MAVCSPALDRKPDTPDLWARHDIRQQDSAGFWLRDAKCLVFEEEFGLTPCFKDRVVQEQTVGVWTRAKVLSQPPCPAHSLLFSLFPVYFNCPDIPLKEGAKNVPDVPQKAARQL